MSSASALPQTLRLLPPLAITGIGSLPHTQLELGLQMALQVDVPYLPQLPTGAPAELMIPQALEGLPGLAFDADGLCTVDLTVWEAGEAALAARLEAAVSSGDWSAFQPSPEACRAWFPFLFEVEQRHLAFAKVHLAGPATVRWVAKTSDGTPTSEVPRLDQQIFRLILARALALVQAVRKRGANPLFFLDEPGLYALDTRNPRHLLVLQELRLLIVALQREGALVGLHCCSNTDWGALLGVGANILSLDVRLSLDALLEERRRFRSFVAAGGTLSLGLVPTNLTAEYRVDELLESVEASLRASLPEREFPAALRRMLLTPACGLAMRTVVDAERIFQELRGGQRGLRSLVEAEAAAA